MLLGRPGIPPLSTDELVEMTRETYDSPMVVAEDLIPFEIGDEVTVMPPGELGANAGRSEMLLKRFQDAKPYDAPNHWGVHGLRLQGLEEGGPPNPWIGFSQFLPDGGAGPGSTPFEKVYVVREGEMTVEAGGETVVLGPMDSCTIAPGEERRIQNRSNHVCEMLVVIPPEAGDRSGLLADAAAVPARPASHSRPADAACRPSRLAAILRRHPQASLRICMICVDGPVISS